MLLFLQRLRFLFGYCICCFFFNSILFVLVPLENHVMNLDLQYLTTVVWDFLMQWSFFLMVFPSCLNFSLVIKNFSFRFFFLKWRTFLPLVWRYVNHRCFSFLKWRWSLHEMLHVSIKRVILGTFFQSLIYWINVS